MSRFPRGLRLLCASAFTLAACGGGGDTGPKLAKLSNPANTAAQLQFVSAPFATGAFESFAALHQHFGAAGSGALAAATRGAGAAVSSSAVAPGHALAWNPAAIRALREALASRPLAAGIFPDSARGKTFSWDETAARYVASTAAGAPANGARFLLYATSPPTIEPSRPLTVIGYVDLTDQSTPGARVLRVATVGTTGATALTYATYTISRQSAQSAAWALEGFVTDGVTRLDLTSALTATFTQLTVQTAADVAGEGVHVSENGTVSSTFAVGTDFSLTSGDETVRANGTVTFDTTAHTLTGSLAVTVNGQAFATIAVGPAGPSYTGASGVQLAPADEAALRNLFSASLDLLAGITVLTDPAWVLKL